MTYLYGAHLIDWLALAAVAVFVIWANRAAKIKLYD